MITYDFWVSDCGSHGSGSVAFVDTSDWTEEDWDEFNECAEWHRQDVAVDISAKYGKEAKYA